MEQVQHSGFEAPAIGEIVPAGTVWKKNPDGTISPIYPQEKDSETEENTKK